MMWPFTRRIVVEHRLDAEQFAALIRAIRPPAPLLAPEPEKPKVPEHLVTFEAWLAEQGFPAARGSHYRAAYDVVTGNRAVPEGYSKKELREELISVGAPLPL